MLKMATLEKIGYRLRHVALEQFNDIRYLVITDERIVVINHKALEDAEIRFTPCQGRAV